MVNNDNQEQQNMDYGMIPGTFLLSLVAISAASTVHQLKFSTLSTVTGFCASIFPPVFTGVALGFVAIGSGVFIGNTIGATFFKSGENALDILGVLGGVTVAMGLAYQLNVAPIFGKELLSIAAAAIATVIACNKAEVFTFGQYS
jgi:hypothetical protein